MRDVALPSSFISRLVLTLKQLFQNFCEIGVTS